MLNTLPSLSPCFPGARRSPPAHNNEQNAGARPSCNESWHGCKTEQLASGAPRRKAGPRAQPWSEPLRGDFSHWPNWERPRGLSDGQATGRETEEVLSGRKMYGEPGKQKDEIVPSHRHGSHYVTLQRAVLAQGPGRAGSEGKQSQKARDPLTRRRVSEWRSRGDGRGSRCPGSNSRQPMKADCPVFRSFAKW